eukprot:3721637-Pyramimonas_sp.AAC.1
MTAAGLPMRSNDGWRPPYSWTPSPYHVDVQPHYVPAIFTRPGFLETRPPPAQPMDPPVFPEHFAEMTGRPLIQPTGRTAN